MFERIRIEAALYERRQSRGKEQAATIASSVPEIGLPIAHVRNVADEGGKGAVGVSPIGLSDRVALRVTAPPD